MRRAAAAFLLTFALLGALAPSSAAAPAGAIQWVVDHKAKTITVTAQLEIYSGCSGNPVGSEAQKAVACAGVRSQVTQFLADKIKTQIESVWNKPYYYRCYRLIVNVDVKLGPDKAHIDSDRIAVRIDPSPGGVRSYVDGAAADDNYKSDDPSARVDPTNDGRWETTWSEALRYGSATYAHEFGHVIGLSDGYHDVTDPQTGRTSSQPYSDAPVDLMSTGRPAIAQETINRVVRRNFPQLHDTSGKPVTESDLKCDMQLTISDALLHQSSPGGVLSYDLSVEPVPDAPVKLTVDEHDAFSTTVTAHVHGPVKALLCTGNYDTEESLTVAGTVETTATGDRVAHIKMSGPPGGGTTKIKCPGNGASIPISGGGGFANRWTIGIGPLDLVVTDPATEVVSDMPVSGLTTHVTGSFFLDYAAD